MNTRSSVVKRSPPREQLLLHDVLQATRREGRCACLLVSGEFFAEPAHRAIEVMQVEALDALDPVILPPALGGAIRAARKQAGQNGEENRAFQRKIMPARTGEALDDRPTARLLPQALEHQGGPDPSRRARRRLAVGDGAHDDGLVGEARARPQQPLQLPALAQIVQATERGDDLLAHRPVLATVLDNLEIGATAGGLLAEKHGAEPRGDSFVAHTKSTGAPDKSIEIWDYVAPRFRERGAPESIISTI